ncbi:MAG: hypothetical protein AABY86_11535 [Bdellovibrionota bacterium]
MSEEDKQKDKNKDESIIQLKQRTMVLFMAIGMALASVTTLEDFVILAILDFFLFAIATYLKDKSLLESSSRLQETSDVSKHPFIFLGEEIKSETTPISNSPLNRNVILTPDDRYTILASPNLHLKRIIFTLFLSAIHFFFIYKLLQKNLNMTSIGLIGSGMLCLATLWIFFRIWQKGQFQLVMLVNWCGVALLTRAPTLVIAIVIPIYIALSFHILQGEREKFSAPLWATSWSYCLKFCAVWWLCLMLMGSIVPNKLFHSLRIQYHKMSNLLGKRGHAPSPVSLPLNQAKQSLEQLSQSLSLSSRSLAKQMAENPSANTGEQLEQITRMQSQAQDLVRQIDQKTISPDQLSQQLKQFSEELEQAQISSGSSPSQENSQENTQGNIQKNIDEQFKKLQALAPQLSEQTEQTLVEQQDIPKETSPTRISSESTKKKEQQAQKSWERYKNLLFKVAIFILILLLAKLFEKKAKSHEKESDQLILRENFKKKWKSLLAKKQDGRTLVIETYQLLAEANQAFLITDKPFCPPYIVYPDVPTGPYQKEWPTVANLFLKTFYGEKAIDRGELKLFANSANRLFNVYFTKSLDQAITGNNDENS